ncbi:MAG: LacI family DNA-binding transcriptional regulator [Parvularculaceae bacterium]
MTKKVTMVDLARLAEVDISTVSRALNDSPLVKTDTKEHILKIASEIGYVVNASARNLRRQSSEAIGIVIPLQPGSDQTISDPFFLEMVGAVSHAASQKGYDLVISVPQSAEQIAERRLLQTGRADGLIVIGQAGRSERLNALGALAQKVVVWGGRTGDSNYTLVGSDNVEGGRLATDHLLSLGRKTILFLGDATLPEVRLRYDGLRAAHREHGQSHSSTLSLPLSFGGDASFASIGEFIKAGHKFDAVFAASDVLAMSCIHALQANGLSVPDDVAVVGYDNIGQAAMAAPSLTTIDQNIKAGGEMMVDLLLKKISGKVVESQITQTKLIIRKSTSG